MRLPENLQQKTIHQKEHTHTHTPTTKNNGGEWRLKKKKQLQFESVQQNGIMMFLLRCYN
jgi:hypothetical protein